MKILFLIFFYSQTIFSQNSQLDSLQAVLNKISTDKERLKILLEICEKITELEIKEGLIYFNQSIELSKNLSDTLSLAKIYNYYGTYLLTRGDYSKANEYLLMAINLSEKKNYQIIYESSLNIISIVHLRTKNFEKAKEILLKLIEISKAKRDIKNEIKYSLNYATLLAETGDLSNSENILLKLLPLAENEIFYRAVVNNTLSLIYNSLKDYKKSYSYAEQAYSLSLSVGNVNLEVETLTNMANALYGQRKFKESILLNNKILSLAKANGLTLQVSNTYGNLYLNYEGLGDYKNAFSHLVKHISVKDSLLNENISKQINELQTRYETEKKETQLADKQKELETQSKLNLSYLSIIIVLVLLIISVIIFFLKQKKQYQTLIKINLSVINEQKKLDAIKSYLKSIIGSKFDDYNFTNIQENHKIAHIADDKKSALIEKVNSFIITKKFLDKEVSLEKLATELGTNTKYLSQIVHEIYKTNFSDFINELRINEARKMLASLEYDQYSIEGISTLVGFSSKQSFFHAFKKFTGVTPNFYKNQSR